MTIGMSCPACGKGGALTIDSRGGPTTVRRRRECPCCKHRWTTYELAAEAYEELVKAHKFIVELERQLSIARRVR